MDSASLRWCSCVVMLLSVALLAGCALYPTGSLEPLDELTPCEPVSCWLGKSLSTVDDQEALMLVASLPGFERVAANTPWKKDGMLGRNWVASKDSQVSMASLDGTFVSLVRWFKPVRLAQVVDRFGEPSYVHVWGW